MFLPLCAYMVYLFWGTPVWFVQDGETLHTWTYAGPGKVKRIRRDGSVRVVPCAAASEPRGEWINAHAVVDASPEAIHHVEGLMKKKYGLSFLIISALGRVRGTQNVALKISIA